MNVFLVLIMTAAIAADSRPPEGAIVLFDGKNMDAWQSFDPRKPLKVKIVDGTFDLEKNNAVTVREFGDFKLHVEFLCPVEPPEITGQKHGNSGVYLHDRYEIQILGHRGTELPTDKEVGAIYGVKRPDRVATRPDGTWQTFDCVFRAPRFDESGKKVSDARLTLHHNGVLIHDDVPIPRPTGGARGEDGATGPVRLQDKNHPVLFRNIWIETLD